MAKYVEFQGETVEFPDNMSDEDIAGVLAQQGAPQGGSPWENFLQTTSEIPGIKPVGEFASAFNRSVMQGLDFLVPGTVNAALRLAGSETQLPTFEGAYENIPGAQGGFMSPGTPRDVVRGAGGAAPAAVGFTPVAGRNIATPFGAASELLGLGTAAPRAGLPQLVFSGGAADIGEETIPILAREAAPGGEAATVGARDLIPESRQTRRVGALIDEGSESAERAGKTRDPYTGRVVDDPAAMESARQGLDPAVTASIQATNPETRASLRGMLDIVEEGQNLARERVMTRPLDVAGESFAKRYRVVESANTQARNVLDDVAKNNLRGQQADASAAFNQFSNDLDSMGVSVVRNEDGDLVVDAAGSDIMGLGGPIDAIERLLQRIDSAGATDAYSLHQVKRFIDENVSYGRSVQGLSGQVERIMKNLRRGIDQALDAQFPEYNRVNTQYSETRELLDEASRLIGSGAGPESRYFGRDMGTLLSRIDSRARSSSSVLQLIEDMDGMAQRYNKPGQGIVPYAPNSAPQSASPLMDLDEDIVTQVMFGSELERLFGPSTRNSFAGLIDMVAERTQRNAPRGMGDLVAEGASMLYDRARGVNEENAMEALKSLLAE